MLAVGHSALFVPGSRRHSKQVGETNPRVYKGLKERDAWCASWLLNSTFKVQI